MERRRSDRVAKQRVELERLRGAIGDGEPYAGTPSSHLTAEQLEERVRWYGLRAEQLLLEARRSPEAPPAPIGPLAVIDGGGEAIEGRAKLKLV